MLRNVAIAAALAGAATSGAHAAATADQSNLAAVPAGGSIVYSPVGNVPTGANGFNEISSAQFITVGKTGTLKQIDLQVTRFAPQNVVGAATVTLARNVIFDNAGYISSADILRQFTVGLSDLPFGMGGGLLSLVVGGPALNFNAGDVFAIGLDIDSVGGFFGGWSVGTSPSNPFVPGVSQFDPLSYSGGLGYRQVSPQGNDGPWAVIQADYGFRTWVESAVPEPQTWALTIVGFGLTGCVVRRRNGKAMTAAA
jgi:hypothetical protein